MMAAPINYGTDTSCLDAIRTGTLASGVQLVVEAAYRRLITPRGSLQGGEDEQNYGLDLADAIGSAVTASTAAALPGRIQSELLKDERIASVSATVTSTTVGASTSWTVAVEGTTSNDQPFSLVLSVSQVSVQLLGFTAGA